MTGLIDRDGERRVLDRLVSAVRAGESRVLVVRGDPGVGKTVLLDYLAERARGCRVARMAGMQSEMELAFAGIHQLCTPMLDHAGSIPAPQQNALRTAIGLAGTAWRGPPGMVIPALHDAANDRPIGYTPVCAHAAGVPVCLNPAYRRYLPDMTAALRPVLAEVAGLPADRELGHALGLAGPAAPRPGRCPVRRSRLRRRARGRRGVRCPRLSPARMSFGVVRCRVSASGGQEIRGAGSYAGLMISRHLGGVCKSVSAREASRALRAVWRACSAVRRYSSRRSGWPAASSS